MVWTSGVAAPPHEGPVLGPCSSWSLQMGRQARVDGGMGVHLPARSPGFRILPCELGNRASGGFAEATRLAAVVGR